MSWFSSAKNWVADTVSNIIPNEVKNVVADIIPNEIKGVLDSVIPSEIQGPIWGDVITKDVVAKQNSGVTPISTSGAPTYDETLLKAFNAQLAIEPKLLEANKLYQPQWLELQKQSQATTAQAQMDLMKGLYPQAGAIEAAYQNQLRGNQVLQLQTMLPQYQQAFNALTPGYTQAMLGMGQLAQNASIQANQPVQLTNFESQIANPYGRMSQQPVTQMGTTPPPGGVYPNGLVWEGPESKAPTQPTQIASPSTTVTNYGTPIGPTTQGPRAPTPEDLARAQQQQVAQATANNDRAMMNQIVADQKKLAAIPQLAQAQQMQAAAPQQMSSQPNYASQYSYSMPGMRQLTQQLGRQANMEIAAGKGLTREEERMATQAARAAYAARGTALGPQAIGAEILKRADVANQRYQQRLANAAGMANTIQGIEALNLGAQQQAFNQALQRGQAEQQRLMGQTAIQAGRAQLASGALGQLQAAQAPVLQAYYQQPILQQTVGQAQTMGLANQQAAGNSLFQPESSLAFQSAFLPYQSSIALQQAQLMGNASKSAGTNSMIGNLGSAIIPAALNFLGFCWVAREVYGAENGIWKVFRSWMLNEAPEWLRNAYIKYGPEIAEFIKDKPVLKAIIRRWMDSKIENYLTA